MAYPRDLASALLPNAVLVNVRLAARPRKVSPSLPRTLDPSNIHLVACPGPQASQPSPCPPPRCPRVAPHSPATAVFLLPLSTFIPHPFDERHSPTTSSFPSTPTRCRCTAPGSPPTLPPASRLHPNSRLSTPPRTPLPSRTTKSTNPTPLAPSRMPTAPLRTSRGRVYRSWIGREKGRSGGKYSLVGLNSRSRGVGN